MHRLYCAPKEATMHIALYFALYIALYFALYIALYFVTMHIALYIALYFALYFVQAVWRVVVHCARGAVCRSAPAGAAQVQTSSCLSLFLQDVSGVCSPHVWWSVVQTDVVLVEHLHHMSASPHVCFTTCLLHHMSVSAFAWVRGDELNGCVVMRSIGCLCSE